jgi:hypothetical protein
MKWARPYVVSRSMASSHPKTSLGRHHRMHAKSVVVSNDRSVSNSFQEQHLICRSLILAETTRQ